MKDENLRDISEEIGFAQPTIPDQIGGKWFPDTPVKPGTRWFYRLLLAIVLGGIIAQVIGAVLAIIDSL